MFYFDVTYWDWAMWSEDDMEVAERNIHEVLFPNIEFLWADYCSARGLLSNDTPMAHAWRNAKCDVQALWSHIHHRREVFVTSDKNFHAQSKKPALLSLGANQIETPTLRWLCFMRPKSWLRGQPLINEVSHAVQPRN